MIMNAIGLFRSIEVGRAVSRGGRRLELYGPGYAKIYYLDDMIG